jgi:hypothetical protein
MATPVLSPPQVAFPQFSKPAMITAEETAMNPVRLTAHARLQCAERGADQQEVEQAVREGTREPAKRGRMLCRFNFTFNSSWQDNHYAVKQVAPVVKEGADEVVVIAVYVFYV